MEIKSDPIIEHIIHYFQAANSSWARIGAPPQAADLCPRVEAALRIAHLPPAVTRMLELRLNQHAIGTLKNWEYIGASLGASLDEIANLRSSHYTLLPIVVAFPPYAIVINYNSSPL